VFCGVLEDYAKRQEVLRLEEKATLLTIDVMGRVILDTKLDSQTSSNTLATAITNQVAWIPQARPHRPWEILNPMFLFVMWWNNRKMDSYISTILEHRFAEGKRSKKGRNVIDLAFDAYLGGKDTAGSPSSPLQHANFKKDAICEIKTLMFAGHDTVSGTLCYAFYLLNRHPHVLGRIRAEHTSLFGDDPDSAAQIIEKTPHVLQKLDYTQAVLKEILRLYPPASTVREGSKE
jgi:cytochrome P450